jgi:beta-lactamase regulating signal transducer with metallopeptidase domain
MLSMWFLVGKMPWLSVLGCLWGMGIAWFAVRHACRIVQFEKLLRNGQGPSSSVQGMAEGIAKRLGLRRMPEIRMLPVCMSPLVWSLGGRPKIFLPAALFARLDGNAQESILAHELAHVQRKDHWIRLLEMGMTTLFWWHPVAWWAARQLQELEDQCCDQMVMDLASHDAKTYATALLDTLDFLSERPMVAPLGATAAKTTLTLTRRIAMLKNRSRNVRWTFSRLLLLLAVAALPMTLAFGQKTPESAPPAKPSVEKTAVDEKSVVEKPIEKLGEKPSVEKPSVEKREIHKLVSDFPEKTDLSTPESACAAFHRIVWEPDPKLSLDMSVWKYGAHDVQAMKQEMKAKAAKEGIAARAAAYRNAEILEVLFYQDGLAMVISKLKLSDDNKRDPYSIRTFFRINGEWKNAGENRLESLERAEADFDRSKDDRWEYYVKILDGIKNGKPVSLRGEQPKRAAAIAPGEELGISVEKADLMGRVEWAMMHGMRDVTARKTIEWGDIEKDADGNRKIRYKFFATIWDKDVYIMNMVFTFDAKGNILDTEDVEGFPQKKVVKPADISTQAGMKELVEDFFSKNFRDITSREEIEWGDVEKAENGNASIRYKYRATIWGKDVKVMNQVFTFNPKGEYVSYKNVDGFPQNP